MSVHGDRYAFLHLPKTAGLSLRTLLEGIFSPEEVSPSCPIRRIGVDEARALNAHRVIAEHISIADIDAFFTDRLLFTFLRDPVDRCLSLYGFFRQLTHFPLLPLDQIRGRNDATEATSLARQLDPEDFCRSDNPHVRQHLSNRMTWQLGHRAAIEHRGEMSEENALAKARETIDRCLVVGFYETVTSDTGRLCDALGAPRERHVLPLVNRTIAPIRKQEISPATQRLLERSNELDRRLYDYAWESLHGRSKSA